MQQVESKLARVGQNCNTRNLDRIARSTAKTHAQVLERNAEQYTFASQLSVLRSCPMVITRLMKREGAYLLVAKVLVISRLLHKALSQAKNKSPLVDQLRDKLGSLRSKLLRRIDKRLANAGGETETLVGTMCAYSLATSSTPTDVLRHFHYVRMEKILGSLDSGPGLKEHGVQALKLCLQTCWDTQAIFPRRLADALAKLKAHPLVQDPDVRTLYELNLDIHHRWLGDEAQNYTPWPRHDELQRAEAERLLHQWSKQAISAFLKGIKAALQETKDLREVSELRQELAETWIVSGTRMAGVKSGHVLDDLRDTMNGQLEMIVRSRAMGVKSVIGLTEGLLQGWEGSEDPLSLWNSTSSANELSNGAQAFKDRIVNTYQGRDKAVIRVVTAYDSWMASVLEVKSIVKSMKEMRWDDPFIDDVELDDSDDEFGSESKHTLLSGDDPRLLEEVTQDALANALSLLGKGFAKLVGDLTEGQASQEQVAKGIFVLRVVREMNDRIPKLRILDSSRPHPSPFTKEILQPLYLALANQIIHPLLESYQKSLRNGIKSKSKSDVLWEGNPPLPATPSPSAFRFLQQLENSMGSHGSDLWVPEGVSALKQVAGKLMMEIWSSVLKDMEEMKAAAPSSPLSEKTGDEATKEDQADDENTKPSTRSASSPSSDNDDSKLKKLKQLLFDTLYIDRYLRTATENSTLESLTDSMSDTASVDDAMKARLRKSAGDYSRKTYLLFALLS